MSHRKCESGGRTALAIMHYEHVQATLGFFSRLECTAAFLSVWCLFEIAVDATWPEV